MAEAKKFKFSDVVLTATDGKNEYTLTPVSMATVDLRGMNVSGEDYYVKKAVALCSTKSKEALKLVKQKPHHACGFVVMLI